MSKNAVVFSTWMPSQYAHRNGLYLSYIREYFGDCDLYIGVNVDSDLIWLDQIDSVFPDANVALVDPELAVNSDVSGFQAALKLVQESKNEYKNVYFMHSKGISYPSDRQWFISCRDYFLQFAEKRKECDLALQDPEVGGWAHIARKFDMKASKHFDQIMDYVDLTSPHGPIGIPQDTMWLITHYAIKGSIVKWFLDIVKPEFFTTNLQDRYFFEVCFPLIVDAYGMKRVNQVFWE